MHAALGARMYAVASSGGNSGVESLPSKQMVAGSNPVPRSIGLPEDTGRAAILVQGTSREGEPASGTRAQYNTQRGPGREALI